MTDDQKLVRLSFPRRRQAGKM